MSANAEKLARVAHGTRSRAHSAVAETIVTGLERGWPKDKVAQLGEAGDEALVKLFEQSTPAVGSRLAALSSRWGSRKLEQFAAKIAAGLLAQIKDGKLARILTASRRPGS